MGILETMLGEMRTIPLTRPVTGKLAELKRDWPDHATPYQIARLVARESIRNLALNWSIELKTRSDNQPGTTRQTREGYEAKQSRVRNEVSLLLDALQEPEKADTHFLARYMSICVAIFALSPNDRMELAGEYQKVLDAYDLSKN